MQRALEKMCDEVTNKEVVAFFN